MAREPIKKAEVTALTAQIIGAIFAARTQAHIFHLRATSYSEHVALNEFYEGILGFGDSLAENHQGRYGELLTIPNDVEMPDTPTAMLDLLRQFFDENRDKLPSEAQNILDEALAQINSTAYKLRFLK
jgi:hypothetical protein